MDRAYVLRIIKVHPVIIYSEGLDVPNMSPAYSHIYTYINIVTDWLGVVAIMSLIETTCTNNVNPTQEDRVK